MDIKKNKMNSDVKSSKKEKKSEKTIEKDVKKTDGIVAKKSENNSVEKSHAGSSKRKDQRKKKFGKRGMDKHGDRRGKDKRGDKQDYSDKEKITGRVEANAKGFGFLVSPDREQDAFIAAPCMNGARHGDEVEAVLLSNFRGGGEARVIKILKRKHEAIVGTFYSKQNFGFCVPDESRIASEIFIAPNDTLGAMSGEKVVVKINEHAKRGMEGKVVEIIGSQGEKGVDILSVIRAYNLYEEFPDFVVDEAIKKAVAPTEKDIKNRTDFRDDLVITIDGDDSKDFDDAVSVSINEKGNYVLNVHIADVAEYVLAGSKLDNEAIKRATSVYFVDRVLPMLPEMLSNDICSLNEKVDRLCLSIVMEVGTDGVVKSYRVHEGVINSKARMTYNNVTKILDGDKELREKYDFLLEMLDNMDSLAAILFKKRQARGNIEFDLPECYIKLDNETGKVVDIVKRDRLVAHKIIEEFMLLANETIAQFMHEQKAPFVYRVHDNPPAEKVTSLVDFLKVFGVKFKLGKDEPKPLDFANMLAEVDEKIKPVINRVTLRTMSKASYETENRGHFGLAAQNYCHFTSPIRRYPDLAIHRIIKDFLHNGKECFSKYTEFVEEASKVSSERERLAEKAERDVNDLKKAEFMLDKVGMNFVGSISGVTEWGIFVELENSVEGLVRTEKFAGWGYEYDAKMMTLSNGIKQYRMGDSVNIIVDGVSGSKVEFALDITAKERKDVEEKGPSRPERSFSFGKKDDKPFKRGGSGDRDRKRKGGHGEGGEHKRKEGHGHGERKRKGGHGDSGEHDFKKGKSVKKKR